MFKSMFGAGGVKCIRRIAAGVVTVICLSTASSPAARERAVFGFDAVLAQARAAAEQPFQDPGGRVPDFLLQLTYDQWRDIRFRPERSLWRAENLLYEVQLFHPGSHYNRIVAIKIIDEQGVRPIAMDTGMFDYGKNDFKSRIPVDLGFAGFRLHFPVRRRDYRDEVVVFLGASYFRALGRGQAYGLSARGLAVDTGLDSGEEFPYFREFWLQKPSPEERQMTVYALLDSPSLTGAYQFVIHPGEATVMNVRSRLFLRREVRKIGIAPLTSMFFYGENVNQRKTDDYRPEIHDSDGLLMESGNGERIWRPLVNPGRLFINAFQMNDLAGFGLLQRDRAFDHYQDPEARYHDRPSAWVKSLGDWRQGHVELVQIPTESEGNDNIVAYWVPAQAPAPSGPPLDFSYELRWEATVPETPLFRGKVIATRSAARPDGARLLLVDFKGGQLARLPPLLPDNAPLEAVVTVSDGGQILEKQLFKLPQIDAWRLAVKVKRTDDSTLQMVLPDAGRRPPLELRAYIRQAETILTETWSYALWP